MYYCPPPSLRGDKTLSCLPGAPASMLQEKNKHKQTKTSTTGSAPQKKQTISYPSPSQRRDKLENLKLRAVVRPRTRTRTFLTTPLRFLRALRWSRPSTLSWFRFALASLGDARARRTCCRCASFRGRQTCCRNYRGAARHILPDRRGHEGLAAFCLVDGTVHHPHKAWCASALRRAPRVCSSTCTLVSVLRLSAVCLSVCVSNLHYCGAPQCLTCTIAGSSSIV